MLRKSTGSGSSTVCVVVGDTSSGVTIYTGTNTSGSWVWTSTPESPGSGADLEDVSCTGSGNTAICGAGGTYSGGSLFYFSTDGGVTWTQPAGVSDSGEVNSVSCTGVGSNAVCALVGQDYTNNNSPLLYVGTGASGWTWNSISTTTDNGVFNGVDCIGSGSSAACVAVGEDDASNEPLLYVVENGGANWTGISLSAANGVLNSVSCINPGTGAVCTAGGQIKPYPLLYSSQNIGSNWTQVTPTEDSGFFDATSCASNNNGVITCSAGGTLNETPLLSVSTNNGGTWNVIPLADISGGIASTSCTGTGANAVCTAVGPTLHGTVFIRSITTLPLLYLSTDGGSTWNSVSLQTLGLFYSTSCTGSGANAVCTAAGLGPNSGPLLYVGQNTSGSWVWNPVSLSGGTGMNNPLFTTGCTGSGTSAVCVAAGTTGNGRTRSVQLYQSVDGGNTWTQALTGVRGEIYSASCTGTGSNVVCTVAGQDGNVNPLLYVGTNAGGSLSWTLVSTGIADGDAYFNATSCTGSGTTAVCIAAGEDDNSGMVLLYQSTNGGSSWNAVSSVAAQAGAFVSASCASAGSTVLCTAAGNSTGGTV